MINLSLTKQIGKCDRENAIVSFAVEIESIYKISDTVLL